MDTPTKNEIEALKKEVAELKKKIEAMTAGSQAKVPYTAPAGRPATNLGKP